MNLDVNCGGSVHASGRHVSPGRDVAGETTWGLPCSVRGCGIETGRCGWQANGLSEREEEAEYGSVMYGVLCAANLKAAMVTLDNSE